MTRTLSHRGSRVKPFVTFCQLIRDMDLLYLKSDVGIFRIEPQRMFPNRPLPGCPGPRRVVSPACPPQHGCRCADLYGSPPGQGSGELKAPGCGASLADTYHVGTVLRSVDRKRRRDSTEKGTPISALSSRRRPTLPPLTYIP